MIQPELIEIHVGLSEYSCKTQMALFDIINVLLQEFKGCCSYVYLYRKKNNHFECWTRTRPYTFMGLSRLLYDVNHNFKKAFLAEILSLRIEKKNLTREKELVNTKNGHKHILIPYLPDLQQNK